MQNRDTISMNIPIVYACSSSGVRAETFQLFFELEGLESVARITPTVTTMIDIWNIHVTSLLVGLLELSSLTYHLPVSVSFLQE